MRVLFLDLDEVCWKGKLLYDEVKLKKDVPELLRQISKIDGVSLFVCSKNNLKDAESKLKEFDILKYFDHLYISWESKSKVISEALKENNIHRKEAIFWDDEPVNRAEVKGIVGCHVDFEEDIYMIMKYFDSKRLCMMDDLRNRDTAQESFEGNLQEFIKQSNFKSKMMVAEEKHIPRIVALTQRTNQLNATQERYTEEDIKSFLESNEYRIYVADASDKYTDYGTIAEIILKKDDNEWIILDLCVSCRVINHKIGTKLIGYVQSRIKKGEQLFGRLRPTEKNSQMKRLFAKSGLKFSSNYAPDNVDYYMWLK